MNTGGEHERAADRRDRAERLRPGEGAHAHRDERLGEREHGGARRADPAEPDDEQHAGAGADGDTPGDEVAEVGRWSHAASSGAANGSVIAAASSECNTIARAVPIRAASRRTMNTLPA